MKTLAAILLLSADVAFAASAGDCAIPDGQVPAEKHELYAFSQSKTIAAISRPLVSSGLLGMGTGGELLWQTRQPLKSTIVVDAAGMKVFNREDKLVNELSDPAIREIAMVFLLLLNGDTEALRESFTWTPICEDEGKWRLELQPVNEQLRPLLREVKVSGRENVETISFTETRGDMTEIHLVPADASRLRELESYLGN